MVFGISAFGLCRSLTQAVIGDKLLSIGISAFAGCVELKNFIVSEQNQ